ncbi:TPA: hypothetical protein ACVBYD_000595 [Yersinia enterocolitica]|uniref:hypothetical protein n=1 Tax=Yersinia TaxID=629 RepID=UPI0005E29B36|nr:MULTISPECIES: hypothetical protein [Yersinia]EKN3942726.1 hypothetical protein [Yersinia enterocolitica]MBW5850202.1 hypothetical protein [Yersinia enterocolitica]MDR4895261.1 hypothetical protein [Yersinia kristensenii]MDX6737811.1 hypothetical protein [Yersinia kristensenii]CNJ74446.1 Uncharacterised protein [Yersinia enterocolitica]
MSQQLPFSIAANQVLAKYKFRQTFVTSRWAEKHGVGEVVWAANQLLDLAGVASYVGSQDAEQIRTVANRWLKDCVTPQEFPEHAEEPTNDR